MTFEVKGCTTKNVCHPNISISRKFEQNQLLNGNTIRVLEIKKAQFHSLPVFFVGCRVSTIQKRQTQFFFKVGSFILLLAILEDLLQLLLLM